MSSIGSVGGSGNSWMMQGMRQRPDTSKMAENLFSKLDTSGQGYIEKSDLQAAFDKISTASTSADALFSKLDGDRDGKVSKQEFTDTLSKLQNDLEQQFQSYRMQMAAQAGGAGGMNGGGGMPPPPPPGEGPSMSKDDLSSALSQIDSSDPRNEMMSNVLANFDAADSDSDGKVSFQEAMAYQQANSSSGSSVSSTGTSSAQSAISSSEAQVMAQLMKLMQAYGVGNEREQNISLLSSLSVSA